MYIFATKSVNFKQITYDDLLDLYFLDCDNMTGSNPKVLGTAILSNLAKKYQSEQFYLIYFLAACEISRNVSYSDYDVLHNINFDGLNISITPKDYNSWTIDTDDCKDGIVPALVGDNSYVNL